MSELYLVRHGQASFGAENYDQLSEVGYEQSRLLGVYFKERGVSFDCCLAGNMQRHYQTLDGISEGMKDKTLGPYQSHSGLNEYDFKAMIAAYGQQYTEDELIQKLKADPADKKVYFRLLYRVLIAWSEGRITDVTEPWEDFQQRVFDVRSMLHDMAESNERILIASSGGAISMFIGWILNLTPEKVFDLNMQIRNTSINHFYLNRSNISLSSFNGIQHLDHPERTQYITYG